jgi:hypothetical protein
MRTNTTHTLTRLVPVVTPLILAPAASAQLTIRTVSIDSGGGLLAGGSLTLRGTVGQPDAGTLVAAPLALRGGFWPGASSTPPPCPPDFDGSGSLDPDDLADFIAAYFTLPPDPRADFDGSGTIDPDDLSDYIGAFFAGCG